MSFKKTLIVFFGIFLCSTISVFAYDDQTTHPALMSEMVEFYNLKNLDAKLSDSDKQFLIQGSREEDTTPRWVNHFYDPIRNEGWTGEHQGDTPALAVRAFTKVGVISRDPLSAINWATNDLAQYDYGQYGGDNSWKTGLQAYARGDRETAMKILGHILHLLEDMAVPDHTRNDSHAPLKEVTGDEGSPYENYAARWNVDSIGNLKIAQTLNSVSVPFYNSIGDYLTAMAQYSNNYFFSKDTTNDPKYENPKITSVDEKYAYGVDENGKNIEIGFVDKNIGLDGKINRKITLKELPEYDRIFDQYFSRLASKAVLNGAGVIELFLKQGEDQKINNEFPTHVIGIDRHTFRTPAFSFVSEIARMWRGVAEIANTISGAIGGIVGTDNKEDVVLQPENQVIEPQEEIVPEQEEVVSNPEENLIEVINSDDSEPNENVDETEKPIRSEFIIATTTEEDAIVVASSSTTSTTKSVEQKIIIRSGSGPIIDAYPGVVLEITEIMYNNSGSDSGKEWIEVFNPGTSSVSLKDMKLIESGLKHSLTFASGSETVSAGGYAIISQSPAVFLDLYPNYSGSLWKSAMSLSNSHDTIAIFGNVRNLGEAEYFSSYGANGDGKSLQKIQDTWYPLDPTPGEENVYNPPRENKKPIVDFSFSPGAPKEREEVVLSASSTDPDGTIQKYVWKFGDGEEFTSVTSTLSHTYTTVGTYTAEVDVYDNDNEFTKATTTISIEPSIGVLADHVVISEIQTGGVDPGDEFVELYNPTTSTVDMTGWSIQYVSGKADEVTKSSVYRKNFVASTSIAGEKFFLIARGLDLNSGEDGYRASTTPDFIHRSFSMSGAPSGGLVFLVNNDEDINSVNDENVVDFVNYNGFALEKGTSLERRGWNGITCASALPKGSGEFQGNGCDTEYMHSDWEVRNTPDPQNSSSMREPRDAPTIPQKQEGKTAFAEYIPNENKIHFYWSNSVDSEGNAPWFELVLKDSTTTTQIAYTTSTEFVYTPQFVSDELSFYLRACDRGGSCSEKQEFSVTIPSYAGDVFFGKRNNGAVIELNPKRFPFIPDFNDKNFETKLVVFLNSEPDTTFQVDESSVLPGSLKVGYKICYGTITETNSVIFPASKDRCVGYGPPSTDFNFAYTEDNIITLTASLPEGKTEFLPSDFITFGFYSQDRYSSWRYYDLVARDKKHYYFDPNQNSGKQPVTYGPVTANFIKENSVISFGWGSPTDSDSYDGDLKNEVAISSSSETGSLSWINEGGRTDARFLVGSDWPSYVHIRAQDLDGNISNIQTEPTGLVSPTILLSQTDFDEYNFRVGYSSVHYDGFDEAEYQNVVVHDMTTFDTVGLKVSKTSAYDKNLRLIVYPSLETGLPDFINPIAETQLETYGTKDAGTEILLSFNNPVILSPDVPYWFSLDAAGASYGIDTNWGIAVKNTSSPTIGRAGWGYGPGSASACGADTCSYREDGQTAHEWWMKIGRRN